MPTQTHTHALRQRTKKNELCTAIFLFPQAHKVSLGIKETLETSVCKNKRSGKTRLILYLSINNLNPPTVSGWNPKQKHKVVLGSDFM